MCSNDELKAMIGNNTQLLEDHVVDTNKKFDSTTKLLKEHIVETNTKFETLTDAISRIAHHSEKTSLEFSDHKKWEEGYRARQEADQIVLTDQISKISEKQEQLAVGNELILDFVAKKNALLSLGSGIKDIALWVIAIGSCGIMLVSWFGG